MIEDVRLDVFVFFPDLVSQKEVHFNRDAELSVLPLGNYQVEVLGHDRMMLEIETDIYAVEL